jgi:hypothetical protein
MSRHRPLRPDASEGNKPRKDCRDGRTYLLLPEPQRGRDPQGDEGDRKRRDVDRVAATEFSCRSTVGGGRAPSS